MIDQKGFYVLLKKNLHLNPRNTKLYKHAFIPKSRGYRYKGQIINNARLEYLGDAVFTLIVSEYLYRHFPDKTEGDLSRIRARIISRNSQEQIALSMGLDKFYTIIDPGNKEQNHLHANTLEALMGALFLDKGFRKTRKYFHKHILGKHLKMKKILKEETDFKSILISWCQQHGKSFNFATQEVKNTEGKRTRFETNIFIDGLPSGQGSGKSKKVAEQKAAENTWKKLTVLPA